jgi:hypothetical protein
MKNKLKILFAYLRNISEALTTTILLDRAYIEDWDRKFRTPEGGVIQITDSIEKILEELIDLYWSEISYYLNFDIDEYWYLEIDIKPNEKTLIFSASCKEEKAKGYKKQYDFKDLNKKNKDFINNIYEENEDLSKFEIQFTGRWDDGEINRVYFDGRKHNFDDDVGYWELVGELMYKAEGTYYWNERNGAEGDLTVWGSVMFLDYTTYDEEYEDTGMRIEITIDNVKEIVEK